MLQAANVVKRVTKGRLMQKANEESWRVRNPEGVEATTTYANNYSYRFVEQQ
jgi:hypothetical protein